MMENLWNHDILLGFSWFMPWHEEYCKQHNFCLTCSLLASIKHTISTTIWFWLKYIQNNHGSGRFILPAARKWENTNLTKLFMGTFPHQQMVDDAEKLNNNRTINQITSNLYILVLLRPLNDDYTYKQQGNMVDKCGEIFHVLYCWWHESTTSTRPVCSCQPQEHVRKFLK